MEDVWWNDKAEEIQAPPDTRFLQGIKNEPHCPHTDPVLSTDGTTLSTGRSEILGRWEEHFNQLLN